MTTARSGGKRVVARIRIAESGNYSEAEASALTGVRPDLLRYYCRIGLLGRERALEKAPIFDDTALYEIRRVEGLRIEFGINRRALPLFCHLLRRVERLQDEIRYLRGP
jgi:DNA-binding transcriptional MerR regulator